MDSRIILHVDMDSFFSSIEVRENPDLKDKAVVVGADPQKGRGRGVVSTCSYEARKFGIHSGMPISRAYHLNPEAVFLPVNFRLYVRVSREVMKILRSYSEKFQQRSIDEAYLDVTKRVKNIKAAEILAMKIKKEILEREGLTCSIGIGPNKLIAKIASDMEKPDGLTVVKPGEVRRFLSPLSVRNIPGIGPKTGANLKKSGVETVGELAKTDVQSLTSSFGRWGIVMRQLAQGIDGREVTGRGEPKSVSRETTFPDDTNDSKVISKTLTSLANYVQRETSEDGFLFKTITLKVRLEDFSTFTRSKTLDVPTNSAEALSETVHKLAEEFLEKDKKIRLLGVKVSGLDRAGKKQTSLDEFGV
jgi:DNA polymerase IV (DinB-like DNA polymerase)